MPWNAFMLTYQTSASVLVDFHMTFFLLAVSMFAIMAKEHICARETLMLLCVRCVFFVFLFFCLSLHTYMLHLAFQHVVACQMKAVFELSRRLEILAAFLKARVLLPAFNLFAGWARILAAFLKARVLLPAFNLFVG